MMWTVLERPAAQQDGRSEFPTVEVWPVAVSGRPHPSGALRASCGTDGRSTAPIIVGLDYEESSFQFPSETTSTAPPATLIAVWSSMA